MTRLAGLVLLSALAIPAAASHPNRTRQEKPRPTQSAEPPLALPVPIPPATPRPALGAGFLEALLCPDRALARFVVSRLDRYDGNPTARMIQLLDESEDLRQARQACQQFWMNNQPRVLTFQRLDGAIGP